MSQFDQVSVAKKANVYFDGKCVSHTVMLADGTRKSVGVILPSTLTFNTGAAEIMETVAGSCRYRLSGGTGLARKAVKVFQFRKIRALILKSAASRITMFAILRDRYSPVVAGDGMARSPATRCHHYIEKAYAIL